MSTLKADTIVASDGTSPVALTKQSAAKAFLNYDQIANTVRDSFNISSVVDNSTSEFDTNFSNSMNNIYYAAYGSYSMNYSVASAAGYSMHTDGVVEEVPTTSNFFVRSVNTGGSGYDAKYNMLSISGDLA